MLDRYRRQGQPHGDSETFSSPLLGWPSANSSDGSLPLFPGASRPVELGYFVPLVPLENGDLTYLREGQRMLNRVNPDEGGVWLAASGRWYSVFGLAFDLAITSERDILPAGEWAIQITIGGDQASARVYEIDLAWSGDEPTPAAVLAGALSRTCRARHHAPILVA